MAKPLVAIVGRPNVGKSTFFNRIAGKRISIVEDTPGVTRDRIYADVEWQNRRFTLIDTGGIDPHSDDVLLSQMRRQAEIAMDTADVICFFADGRDGLTDDDREVANLLRKTKKPILLVVNKVDHISMNDNIYEFYELGLGDPIAISAANMLGLGDLLQAICEKLPPAGKDEMDETEHILQLAVVGRPNVGKSTLLSVVSKAHPKIANYHFTTLFPNLGVVYVDEGVSFVMADIPGIIEGAHEGRGLGTRFLRHIERNSVLLFMIPADSDDIRKDYAVLLGELTQYNPELLDKERLLAITKCDMLDEDLIEEMKSHLPEGVPSVFISSISGMNIPRLKDMLWEALQK